MASLFKNPGLQPFYGGLFIDSRINNSPPEFSQIILPEDPDNFDYEKISIDNNPNSPYYKNIYVFALSKPNFYIIDADLNVTKGNVPTGGPVIESTVVGQAGELYAIYQNSSYIKILRSLDGGKNFQLSRNIASVYHSWLCPPAPVAKGSDIGWSVQNGPSLSIDKNGVLYAVWANYKDCVEDPDYAYGRYPEDYDIYFSKSLDRGDTWTSLKKVNDDNSGGDQGFPNIAVEEDGTIYVSFLDHRNNQELAVYDIYIAMSRDGGITFSRNIKVNDLSIPNGFGRRDPGDYYDMLSIGKDNINNCFYSLFTLFPSLKGCLIVVSQGLFQNIQMLKLGKSHLNAR